MAKDFSKLDISASTGAKVRSTIESATGRRGQQATATPEEQAERAATLTTQGRKGCKAVRINMAFTPENHTFIKVMSKATGRTMAKMINDIIAAYRNEHPELLEKANDFLDFINSGVFTDEDSDNE